jgi:hypothetical protein
MAEEEKPQSPHPLAPILIPVAVIFLLGLLLERIREYVMDKPTLNYFFFKIQSIFTGQPVPEGLEYTPSLFWIHTALFFKIASFLISVILVWGIITTLRNLTKLNITQRAFLQPPQPVEFQRGAPPKIVNKKWEKVLDHINSSNPSDWKLAILEADIMLDEMLDKMSYHGETMGEKLKSVEPSDFNTIDKAWEAHKIRNSIAHEGSDFLMNEREAKRVIALYKDVFDEFRYL